MNPKPLPLLVVTLALMGAAIAGPAAAAEDTPADRGASAAPAGSAPADARPVPPGPPLLLDPADLGLGATVVFRRIPGVAELHDLEYLGSVSHVLLQLPAWPADADALQPLAQGTLPEGADLVVVLPGYPGTRSQVAAWNLLRRPVRIILVVTAPPADREMVFQLNSLRGLERVIADLDRPSRSGFERLQRPLGFRVVMP